MLTVNDIINSKKSRQRKPDEEELRKLPDRKAIIQGRLSGFTQVRESKESVREIALLVDKAIEDGYKTKLDRATVERWLEDIQKEIIPPGIMEDGEVIVNCLGLGISGALPEEKRPDLKLPMDLLKKSELGAMYVTEGANRLSRDPDRVVSATLLKMMKGTNCKLRTPYEVLSPCVERDWEIIHDELERGAEELKSMSKRLCRRRELKAARGEYVGEPVPPGFIVPVLGTKSNGSRIYGKYQPYPPHAKIVIKVLREYVKQGFSKMKTHHVLNRPQYPLFPPELKYMEKLSSLRKAEGTDTGYLISPAMIRLLALNPKLIGIWTWGDTEPRYDNHEAIVPVDLFLEAYQGAIRPGKPRGKAIKQEPLVWNHLLYCCNHDLPIRMSGHTTKNTYRCQSSYIRGRGPVCFDIAAHYLDEPLTAMVLQQLDFTPFAEEILMQLEAEVSHSSLEVEQRKKDIIALERRLENLKPYLGCGNKEREEFYWEQIEKTKNRLNDLRSRPLQSQIVPAADYHLVREFLARLPQEWGTFSRTTRNRLLQALIDRVDILHGGEVVEATIHWKTGQSEVINIRRARGKGNLESRWIEQEKDLLKMLWPHSSQDTMLAAFPGRTWKAIAHQAYNQGWLRIPKSCNKTPRRRWEPEEEHEVKKSYEAGTPITDIATSVGRSQTAIRQRAWDKKWQRPFSDQRMVSRTKQNPIVPNGVSSGLLFGGQVTLRAPFLAIYYLRFSN